MIAIVDYGRGNLGSVWRALARVGLEVVITDERATVERAQALVVPGDGAFADAMGSLDRLDLVEPIRAHIDAGRPYLGICLGYQLLFTESEEFGHAKGLDVLAGTVRRFPTGLKVPHMGWNQLSIDPGRRAALPILDGVPDGAYFYFLHSYYPDLSTGGGVPTTPPPGPPPPGGRPSAAAPGGVPTTSSSGRLGLAALGPSRPSGGPPPGPPPPGGRPSAAALTTATCDYGVRFPALLARGALYGTQFHPEKSQRWGLRLLENFATLVAAGQAGDWR